MEVFKMKVKSSLVASAVAAALLVPAVGTAVLANHTTSSTKTTASVQKQDQREGHEDQYERKHEHGKGEKQKELTNIINQYATPQLKSQLTKDLATRESLAKQLRQTPGFQKKEGQEKGTQEKSQRQATYQAHKKEIDAIEQQVKDGKLTKQQAHQKLDSIFGKIEGKDHDSDKGKEQGTRAIYKELKAAIQKKDKAAINTALEKIDQQLQSANQQLQQKINANK
jgi:hypothetical protein